MNDDVKQTPQEPTHIILPTAVVKYIGELLNAPTMRTIGDFSTALALIQREAKPYQPQPIRAGNSSVEITAEQKLAAIQKAAKAAAASAKAMPPSEDAAD